MDIGRAFSFVTEDESWINKILIGGLLLLIPLIGQLALIGYMLETARNVAQGNPRPLPEWSNFGDKIIQGLYGLIIQLVYALPIVILSFIMACVIISASAAVGGSNEDAAGAMVGFIVLCFVPLILVSSMIIQPVLLAALGRYVQTNNLGAALQIGSVIGIVRSSLRTWVVVWLVYILCGIIGSLGSIAFIIGALFTTVYGQAVLGHVLGQVVARSSESSNLGSSYGSPTYQ
ncbi:MAG: DUF4013 domain-containing protein [Chloroflexales bacterium]|nr:DUF4013 domain-containing protein [Chloroflexales bacterium]